MELSDIRGIGKSRLEALHAAGIFSLRDLLYAAPAKYRDLSRTVTVREAASGERALLALKRQGEAKLARYGGRTRVTCVLTDDTGRLTACWFNQPWMRENMNRGTRFLLYGLVEAQNAEKRLLNPSLEKETRILPLYRPVEGLPQKTHGSIVREALDYVEEVCPETLPLTLLERYGLCSRAQAIRVLHAPPDREALVPARRRFAFEQMLLYQASVRMARDARMPAAPMQGTAEELDGYWASLPFAPTGAQRRTLGEIAADMGKATAMARMVQGDVGSGKTAVALGAMLLCAKAGFQSALMAPTEILARQHYQTLGGMCRERGVGCGLLVGGMAAAERREALRAIREGEWQIVIGTHALIGKAVTYRSLGLCVTDEQHRFGVAQRAALVHKGETTDGEAPRAPHLLVMSATPIPRSLALILYGDLDLSLIDELPPGRLPVKTRLVPEEKRADLYGFVRRELEAGRQAYIVCPLVEENENADGLKAVKAHAAALAQGELKGFAVGLTYGSQPSEEKREALCAFTQGRLKALVSTTVVEVGVNVPNASVMVIEDADRYGLAQLHQLRGRVGRGGAQSWCFLLARPNERLRALTRTNDGFEIARMDLELRGPGELLGTRQHGEASIPGDGTALASMPLLYEAAECARELSQNPERAGEWRAVRELAREGAMRAGGGGSIS